MGKGNDGFSVSRPIRYRNEIETTLHAIKNRKMNRFHSTGKENLPNPISSMVITYQASGRKIPIRKMFLQRLQKSKNRLAGSTQMLVQNSKSKLLLATTASFVLGRDVLPHQKQRAPRKRFMNGMAANRWRNMIAMAIAKLGTIPNGYCRNRNRTSGIKRNRNNPVR